MNISEPTRIILLEIIQIYSKLTCVVLIFLLKFLLLCSSRKEIIANYDTYVKKKSLIQKKSYPKWNAFIYIKINWLCLHNKPLYIESIFLLWLSVGEQKVITYNRFVLWCLKRKQTNVLDLEQKKKSLSYHDYLLSIAFFLND